MASSDLESRSFQGELPDEAAFIRLVLPHRNALVRYIRFHIRDADDADDVLQETMVAAWAGLGRLRRPESAPAWLFRVAHNRCQDWVRRQDRQESTNAIGAWAQSADRSGLHQHRHDHTVTDILEALAAAPPAERDAAVRFYLEDMTVAEIAAQTHAPPGTVKRRLFQARNFMRDALGIRPETRRNLMDTVGNGPKMADAPALEEVPAFPPRRPEIVVTDSDEPPFAVDCPEPPFAVDCPELRFWCYHPVRGRDGLVRGLPPPGLGAGRGDVAAGCPRHQGP